MAEMQFAGHVVGVDLGQRRELPYGAFLHSGDDHIADANAFIWTATKLRSLPEPPKLPEASSIAMETSPRLPWTGLGIVGLIALLYLLFW